MLKIKSVSYTAQILFKKILGNGRTCPNGNGRTEMFRAL